MRIATKEDQSNGLVGADGNFRKNNFQLSKSTGSYLRITDDDTIYFFFYFRKRRRHPLLFTQAQTPRGHLSGSANGRGSRETEEMVRPRGKESVGKYRPGLVLGTQDQRLCRRAGSLCQPAGHFDQKNGRRTCTRYYRSYIVFLPGLYDARFLCNSSWSRGGRSPIRWHDPGLGCPACRRGSQL